MLSQTGEIIVQIPLDELFPLRDHPFSVNDDELMEQTVTSIKSYGVLLPAIVRPREEGGYEIIAGHRRHHACGRAGLTAMPCVVRDVDYDTAVILMVDSNIQRENTPISEKAKAIKMKYEAIKRQGARTDLTSPKISAKLRSDDEIGRQMGMSGDSVRNYMALTELVPELMQMVDDKKIALTPAYQIATLTQDEQRLLLDTIDSEQATPSLSQAQRMKKLSQSGELNDDTMLEIMMEQKKPEYVRRFRQALTAVFSCHKIKTKELHTMKRPLAYITAPWGDNEYENTEEAAKYCRAVYDPRRCRHLHPAPALHRLRRCAGKRHRPQLQS